VTKPRNPNPFNHLRHHLQHHLQHHFSEHPYRSPNQQRRRAVVHETSTVLRGDIRAHQDLWSWLAMPLSQTLARLVPVLLLILGDVVALAVAWRLSIAINRGFSPLPNGLQWGEWLTMPGIFWAFAITMVLTFAHYHFYEQEAPSAQNYAKQGQVLSGLYLGSLVVSYCYDPQVDPPRSLFFPAWFASMVAIIVVRLGLGLLFSQLAVRLAQTRRGFGGWLQVGFCLDTPVFLVAPLRDAAKLADVISHRTTYRILKTIDVQQIDPAAIITELRQAGVKEVIAAGLPESELASQLYWQLKNAGIGLRLIPSSLMLLHRRGTPEIFAGMPMIRITPSLFDSWEYLIKRTLDWIGALVGVLLLAPLFALIAIGIKTTSKGSIFYTQERVGLHGQVFRMWKFRTMYMNAEQQQRELEKLNQSIDGVLFKIKRDPRIIPIGHFLRRTSLDELPQLFNVLLGQMTLVGPRPLPIRDVNLFAPWHHSRHVVMPGLTGLWQISGRSNLDSIDDMARLDLFYIDNWSLNLDLTVLLETIRIVLFSKGAY